MSAVDHDPDQQLIDLAAECRRDPLRWVMAAFPWGEPGPLERHQGPDTWQREVLEYVRDNLGIGRPLRLAIAGGVGPGKSSLMAWLTLWAMTTMPDCRCRLTAATGPQLSTATWPEVGKWHRLSLWAPWFEVMDRRLRSVDPAHRDAWRCDAISWDEHNPEAFAGFHNAGRRILYGFDESAAIAEPIWREAEGILAGAEDTEILWIVLGNPTRTNSHFRTLFPGGRNSHLWKSWHIDTRNARMSDKTQISEWIDSYGLDSDFVRVRVLSQFPRAGSTQFIGNDAVDRAMDPNADFDVGVYESLVMGVDVARFGDDQTVITMRRGRDARSFKPVKLRGLDTMQVAARIAELYHLHRPDAIFVDAGGIGAGVVDRCNYLKLPVTGIDFGGKPDSDMQSANSAILYANKRAEMWGRMRDWLEAGAMLNNDPELASELVAVEYGYALRDGKDTILLEKKSDMKKRGLASPDNSDALALTFAHPVAGSDQTWKYGRRKSLHESHYDPLPIAGGVVDAGGGYEGPWGSPGGEGNPYYKNKTGMPDSGSGGSYGGGPMNDDILGAFGRR